MRKKSLGKEKYSIIITSETDARKKPRLFSLTRRALILILSIIVFFVFVCAGVTIYSLMQASSYSGQMEALRKQVNNQTAMVAVNDEPASATPEPSESTAPESTAPEITPTPEISIELPSQTPQEAIQSSQSVEPTTEEISVSVASLDTPKPSPTKSVAVKVQPVANVQSAANVQKSEKTSVSNKIEMKDAIDTISSDFQMAIDKKIEAMKEKESCDNTRILYDGDMDGDSDTVNNWADVLSVFMVETMKNGQKLITITPDNIKLLSDIYYEMNSLSIDCEKKITTVDDPVNGQIASTTLIIHVTVNSLTYSEAASLHHFSKSQMTKLKKLMSPTYYTYFEGLLGIDVYDGMPSKTVENVIASLPDGFKGSEIAKAAIIRLGNPYSKARRGSGNYVDCSYFAWWAYNQAGVSIPKSSVEQAKYCYNKGYSVKLSNLKPGDLIFWSKTSCDCGRWREIHHVGIYIGHNMVIEASSCKGRVVIRKLWSGGEWRINMCARPYTLKKK